MDAQILLSIGRAYNEYVVDADILPRLDSLFQSVDSYISTPNNENLQEVTSRYEDLVSALDKQLHERMPRTWLSIAEELGVMRFSGQALRQKIQSIFRENQVSFDVVRAKLKELRKGVYELTESFKNLDKALTEIGISPYTLDEEEGEISYFIPRDIIDLTPGDFASECKELLFIYRTVSELETGQVENPTIRKISTTEPLIVIAAIYPVVRGVLKIIDQILELYKKVQEARLIKAQADKAGFEAISLAAEKEIQSEIDAGLRAIVNDLMARRARVEGRGRSDPELKEYVERAVAELAARLDNGYRLEADVSPKTKAKLTGPNVRPEEASEYVESIVKIQNKIRYVEFEGEPIFRLPPPANDED